MKRQRVGNWIEITNQDAKHHSDQHHLHETTHHRYRGLALDMHRKAAAQQHHCGAERHGAR